VFSPPTLDLKALCRHSMRLPGARIKTVARAQGTYHLHKGKSMSSSRFIITVIGLDRVGIVAGISRVMAEHGVNIADIRQTIMDDLFTMIMLAEVKGEPFDREAFQTAMSDIGKELGVEVIVQHEDVFRFMHRI
jgi:ACT domain-containing protein